MKTPIEEWIAWIEEALTHYLPPLGSIPSRLPEAMRYSVFTGGKRIRPLLALAACYAVGGDPQKALPFACALEMIHTYSLIHDDLPSMDNDDFRRGKATSHKVFGEALAILAGDGLLTDAFALMASSEATEGLGAEVALKVIREVARAVGTQGMVGGQAVDIEVEGREVDEELIRWIHEKKTAAFIHAATKVGAIIGGADEEKLALIERFGYAFGRAFQLVDDVLDHQEEKSSNLARVKGVKEVREEARRLFQEAYRALEPFGPKAEPLKEIAKRVEKVLDGETPG